MKIEMITNNYDFYTLKFFYSFMKWKLKSFNNLLKILKTKWMNERLCKINNLCY